VQSRTATRIDGLTREKWDAIRRAEAAETQLALMQARLEQVVVPQPPAAVDGQQPPPAPPVGPRAVVPGTPEFQAAVRAESAATRFRERADQIVVDGRGKHGDFDAVVSAHTGRFGPMPQYLIEAALETGSAAEVLYAMAKDPQEADRIVSLSPAAASVALAKLAAKAAGPAPGPGTSSAPAPITPAVGGTAAKVWKIDDDDIPMEEFVRLREASRANGAARR
jgi:hypothetical protein